MQTYISILRGINVSGHKMIKMEVLRKMYAALKFKNIHTYIQSGNVIFQEKKTNPRNLEKKIEKKIVTDFGFEVPVIVKEAAELTGILKNNPFVKRKEDIKSLHVTFLSQSPEPLTIDAIKNMQYEHDEYTISGKIVYLYCPNGYGNTKLNNNFFEKKLKVIATTRNWKTIMELDAIANNISNSQ